MAGAFQSDSFQNDAFQVDTGVTATTTDAPQTADVATRAVVLLRVAADTVTSSDVATAGSGASSRTATDAVSSSDSATRVAGRTRTASEAISTADAATQLHALRRTATDTVSATVAAVRSAGTFHRTASDHPVAADRALALYLPYVAGVAIYLGGTNIAKPDGDPVLFATARFMSAVNGVPGTCSFRARDDLGTVNYVPGQPLQLVINGLPVWTGFVSSVKRVYVFPALNVDDFGPTRFFDIEGVDLNILFTRRIVFNQAHPANVLAPLYGHFTPDITAISALNDGWLDLSGDDLDTSTLVDHVSAINEDQNARGWEGSDQWGQAMTSIASLPAAIFYLDPYRREVYCDTDTPNAPFGLSDAPNGTTTRGYREMEVLFDGTNLANDVMCWGAGYGSNVPVFDRGEDATSIADHGRWQLGQTTFGVYKQATIERIVDSIINGSPDHHRGAKDDRKAVTITTYEPGLLPAQKVNFESTVFGWSDVLPIRKMEVTFPAPDKPKYELTLSQEIDTPWSFFDPWKFRLPGFQGSPFPPFVMPDVPGGCDCRIFDSFTRTLPSTWGTSDSTIPWDAPTVGFGSLTAASVNGTTGVLVAGVHGSFNSQILVRMFPGWIADFDCYYDVEFQDVPGGGDSNNRFDFNWNETNGSGATFFLSQGVIQLNGSDITFSPSGTATIIGGLGGQKRVRAQLDAVGIRLKFWDRVDPEPVSWTIYDVWSGSPPTQTFLSFRLRQQSGQVTPITTLIDDISVTIAGQSVDRCSQYRFDNFNRTVGNAWGTTTFGDPWVISNPADASMFSVTPGVGTIAHSSGSPQMTVSNAADPWALGEWTMSSQFSVGSMGGGQSDFVVYHQGGRNRLLDFRIAVDGTGYIELDFDGGGATQAPFAFGTFGTYICKWHYVEATGLSEAKVWNIVDPEPGSWMVTLTSGPGDGPATSFDVHMQSKNPSAGFTYIHKFNYIDFDYTGKPCYSGGPPPTPPSPGGPAFGPICEVATRTDSTHYQLTKSFIHLSEQVYVGTPGLLVRPGVTLDYTTDPEAGIIIFNDAIASPTERVFVCYTALGPVA